MTKLGNYSSAQNEHSSSAADEPKQIVFEVENLPKMVLKFEDLLPCLACELSYTNVLKSCDYERFVKQLKDTKLNENLPVNEIMKNVSKSVNCISCRATVERLIKQILAASSENSTSLALDPIRINKSDCTVSIKPSLLKPESLYALLYIDSSKLEEDLNQLVSKKQVSKRCQLHSTDVQKQIRQKWLDEWMEFWDSIESDECRKNFLVIDSAELLDTLNKYLKRNKFCSECKLTILVAFKSLTKEAELEIDNTNYKPTLFEGIECCFNENDPKEPAHLHIPNDREYIADLIVKAIPDIHGEMSERHAKSFEMAQEEVLTCVGLYIYDRLLNVYQAMRIQEHAWKILFYTSVLTFVKNFKFEIEKKNFDLDQICAELEAIDESKKQSLQKQTKTKSKSKRSKSSRKSDPKEEEIREVTSIQHTCYSAQKPAKIISSPSAASTSKKSTCNKKSATASKQARRIQVNSFKCECDDESKFVHTIDDFDAKQPEQQPLCEKSCCFDIIAYWNKLVKEEQEASSSSSAAATEAEAEAATNGSKKRVIPRRLKINYVDDAAGEEERDQNDVSMTITEEEKREYFENKARYWALRLNNRQRLMQNWMLLSKSASLTLMKHA